MNNDNATHSPEATDPATAQQTAANTEAADTGAHNAEPQDLGASAEAISPLLEQIALLQTQLQEERERTLRAVADLENFRKRLVREKEEIRRKAAADFVEDLLPALDNFQIGLQHAEKAQTGADVAKGFEFIVAQINQILSGHGLSRVEPAIGAEFDHNLHEAVGHEPNESTPDHHILRVMRIGYSLNERLLRPASVIVSSGPAAQQQAAE